VISESLLVIIVCVAALVLGLAVRVVHPYRAMASGVGAIGAAAAGAVPTAPTLTVPATYTVPGTLALDWPASGQAAVAVAGIGSPRGVRPARLGPARAVSLIAWPGLALTLRPGPTSVGPVLDVTAPGGATVGKTQLTAI
jgi:hypothetical protein